MREAVWEEECRRQQEESRWEQEMKKGEKEEKEELIT